MLPHLQSACRHHVRERRRLFVLVPRTLPMCLFSCMPRLRVPHHYQRPHEPRHRACSLHALLTPHLRIVKSHHLFGIAKGHLHTPPPTIPGNYFLGRQSKVGTHQRFVAPLPLRVAHQHHLYRRRPCRRIPAHIRHHLDL